MTTNQVKYWELQEAKRHNVAQEDMDRPLKQSQTEYYIELAPKTKAETGYTKVGTIVKGIEGFERAASGLHHISSAVGEIVRSVTGAASAF